MRLLEEYRKVLEGLTTDDIRKGLRISLRPPVDPEQYETKEGFFEALQENGNDISYENFGGRIRKSDYFDSVEVLYYVTNAENPLIVYITDQCLNDFGISIKEAWAIAKSNMLEITECMLLDDFMLSKGFGMEWPEYFRGKPIYILTTTERFYGAGAIVNLNVIQRLFLDMDAYDIALLPSSVHEILIVPFEKYDWEEYVKGLEEIVRGVNNEAVRKNMLLSNIVDSRILWRTIE